VEVSKNQKGPTIVKSTITCQGSLRCAKFASVSTLEKLCGISYSNCAVKTLSFQTLKDDSSLLLYVCRIKEEVEHSTAEIQETMNTS
jgi:hypothetical protein